MSKPLSKDVYLVALFAIIAALLLSRHEMWIDEVQAWLIARDSDSLTQIIDNLRYESHPPLWHLLLMPLAHSVGNIASMQVLHWLISVLAVALFVRCAPFEYYNKILFVFGYFILYEYTAISRNYNLGVLFIFCFCLICKGRETRFELASLALVLLALSSAMGAIVAVALLGGLLFEALVAPGYFGALSARRKRLFAAAVLSAMVAIGLVLYQLRPPTDSGIARDWLLALDREQINDTLAALGVAYNPVPKLQLQFWNTSRFSIYLSAAFAVAAIGVAAIWMLKVRCPIAVVTLLGATGGLLLFFYAKFDGENRHHGFLFLAFVASLWLAQNRAATEPPAPGRTAVSAVFTCVLLLHLIGGGIAASIDFLHPFSNAPHLAKSVPGIGEPDVFIAAYPDIQGVPLLGYLEIQEIYYPQALRYGSFIVWNNTRAKVSDAVALSRSIAQFQASGKTRFVYVTNEALPEEVLRTSNLRTLFESGEAILKRHNNYVYGLQKN